MTPEQAIQEVERRHAETIRFMDKQEREALAKVDALANRHGKSLAMWALVNVLWSIALLAFSVAQLLMRRLGGG